MVLTLLLLFINPNLMNSNVFETSGLPGSRGGLGREEGPLGREDPSPGWALEQNTKE